MALLDPLFKIAAICSSRGVEEAIIAPGSRSASLSLAFARTANIKTRVISDERSAGFVALGIAQITKKPVVLICTSGTAALNFAPAVAEAYFQKIPLLILTADRPPEWIHQYDGQTIFQSGIYGAHVLKSYDFPVDYSHPDAVWQIQRDTHEALAYCKEGPVHINVPIREPFYPKEAEEFSGEFRNVSYLKGEKRLGEKDWTQLMNDWNRSKNIVIAVGQNYHELNPFLEWLSKQENVTVWSDIISNVQIENRITTQDLFLNKAKSRQVDLLITLGKSFISKSFKLYFRKNKATTHWQVGEDREMIDALQSISQKILISEQYFLEELCNRVDESTIQNTPYWFQAERTTKQYLKTALSENEWSELKATYTILQNLREGDILHLGNSMPVRYANYLQAFLPKGIKVYANRGTSGIDGIVSTALGQALKSEGRVHCIVGDVSFFYDSNALFGPKVKNLTVYLMNNSGGNIFRVIDGPSRQPELDSLFLTNTGRNARNLASDAGYQYMEITEATALEKAIQNQNKAAVFELFLNGEKDVVFFKKLKDNLRLPD